VKTQARQAGACRRNRRLGRARHSAGPVVAREQLRSLSPRTTRSP